MSLRHCWTGPFGYWLPTTLRTRQLFKSSTSPLTLPLILSASHRLRTINSSHLNALAMHFLSVLWPLCDVIRHLLCASAWGFFSLFQGKKRLKAWALLAPLPVLPVSPSFPLRLHLLSHDPFCFHALPEHAAVLISPWVPLSYFCDPFFSFLTFYHLSFIILLLSFYPAPLLPSKVSFLFLIFFPSIFNPFPHRIPTGCPMSFSPSVLLRSHSLSPTPCFFHRSHYLLPFLCPVTDPSHTHIYLYALSLLFIFALVFHLPVVI